LDTYANHFLEFVVYLAVLLRLSRPRAEDDKTIRLGRRLELFQGLCLRVYRDPSREQHD